MRKLVGKIAMEASMNSRLVLLFGASVAAAVVTGGCADTMTRSPKPDATIVSPWASPTAIMRWNEFACDLITRNLSGQQASVRTLVYLNLAISNAIVTAEKQKRGPDGAATGAAATVLAYLFPNDAAAIMARLAGETRAIGAGARRDDFAAGVQIGEATAAEVVASARADRYDLAWTGTVPSDTGKWSSRLQPTRPPIFPRLGEMRPFFLAIGSEFRPPPPPALDSAEFKTAITEVRLVADTRTPEQLRIAQYWENLTPPYTGGAWNEVARDAISAHGLSDSEAARVLTLAHMAQMDAFIACHDAKYVYWFPRPSQVDPGIQLAIVLPNHPSYPANHGCVSTAFATVLDVSFPDQGGRYTAMARQAAESRIYGGIHYRFDVDVGMDVGRKVAAKAVASGLPRDRVYVPAAK
jgi:hypothetical protein